MPLFSLETVGLITTLFALLKCIDFIYLHLRPSSLRRYLHTHDGSPPWALVTGSSDGIGLGFVNELASRGFNVVLHGRNSTKLDSVCSRLKTEFPNRSFRTVIVDASETPSAAGHRKLEVIAEQLSDIRLAILVNNVGGVECVTENRLGVRALSQQPAAEVDRLIQVNLGFATQLTRALLPLLTKAMSTEPSLIINIGSIAARGFPFAAVYGGAKAYNMAWSTGLTLEMQAEGHHVEVLGIIVGTVTGCTHRKETPSLVMPDVRSMAKAALQKVGCGRPVVAGFWAHGLQLAFLDVLSDLLPHVISMKIKTAAMRAQQESELRNR